MDVPCYESYQAFCNDNAVSIAKTQTVHKKPRHRHSPKQLAALNELFEQNEHPPLEQRTALAERLGMETKTVNAWFQNKRASSKKKVKGGGTASHDLNSKSLSSPPSSQPTQQQPPVHRPEVKTLCDDPRDSDTVVHESRNRPHEEQLEELRKVYSINSHPTPEIRQALSVSLGMTYEKVTNWFQNQRYLTKKRNLKEDEDEIQWHPTSNAEDPHEAQLYSAYSPPSYPHPSLSLPPPTSHPSIRPYSTLRRSPSISPSMEDRSRRSSSRLGTMPYRSAGSVSARTRRSRPEPYQLKALKKLFRKTSIPTIEERSSLALEIGMDIGKVTNWFRNLRQSSRKRCKKPGCGEDDDDDDAFQARDPYSASSSVSRSGSPLPASPMFIKGEDPMDLGSLDDHCHTFSVDNSEDEYQEAVTPPPEPSSSPPPGAISQPANNDEKFELLLSRLPYPIEIDKASVERFPGIKVEDALLLLSFHHHIVQY